MSIQHLISELKNSFGTELTSTEIKQFCEINDQSYISVTRKLENCKTGRGKWNLDLLQDTIEQLETACNSPLSRSISTIKTSINNLIPEKNDTFVKFGNFNDIKKIIQAGIFYPAFITGLSGNGKTFSVEQACAQLEREFILVNITIETDEDDLLGGFRLIDGNTVWYNGPVVEALERGAILLLDELDLASNKILCLQSVLDGKGVFLKKIGKYIKPKDGFNIFATANTKGKGSEDGRFIGTNVLNEAFIERFCITFEQEYPSIQHETKILQNVAASLNILDVDSFIKSLVDWADVIRKTFYDGGIDEIISTRRLVHIMRAYGIFNNKTKAIGYCINRFDEETKTAFIDLYSKIDSEIVDTVESEEIKAA